MNIKQIYKQIERVDDCDHPAIPDTIKISKQDQKLIRGIVDILAHERFNHGGWIDGNYGYMDDAAYFIVQYLKGKLK